MPDTPETARPETARPQTARHAPAGTRILVGKDGPQRIRSSGRRWTDEAEDRFLDHLAASCNVTAAADAAGFSRCAIYKRRRKDPGFAQRWDAAIAQGYARIEAELVRHCVDALEGRAPDPDTPIPVMTVHDALAILRHHRPTVEGGPRTRRQWARPRSLDEVRDSILAKLAAFAPVEEPRTSCSTPPQDEPDLSCSAHPEERAGLSLSKAGPRLEGR